MSRVVVLDDDPTGTQTVSGLPVVLDPRREVLQRALDGHPGALWVLTNTRSMAAGEAGRLVTEICGTVRALLGDAVELVLRGDSTLRGHVVTEFDALDAADPDPEPAAALWCPAFVEVGRVTVHGVQLVPVAGGRVPAARTEYARDPVFGYGEVRLVDLLRRLGRVGRPVELLEVRRHGSVAIRDALLAAAPGEVVVPDAETSEDVVSVAAGVRAALLAGRRVHVRAAASLAAALAGAGPRHVQLAAVGGPVLVVCGSHTEGASAQLADLARLLASWASDPGRGGLGQVVEVPVPGTAADACRQAGIAADSLTAVLAADGVAVLATPRQVADGDGDLLTGRLLMDALVAAVRELSRAVRPAAVVVKGGISAARVVRDGLAATVCDVLGQVTTGVPVWRPRDGATPGIPYVVVPGNVGTPSTLSWVTAALVGLAAPGDRPPGEGPLGWPRPAGPASDRGPA